MKLHKIRGVARWVHIAAAVWFGTTTYSPIGAAEWAWDVSAFVVFPVLALTGLTMWKPRVVQRFAGGQS